MSNRAAMTANPVLMHLVDAYAESAEDEAVTHESSPCSAVWAQATERRRRRREAVETALAAARPPIERYVRAQVEIRAPAANLPGAPPYIALGVLELGLHYERGERPSAFRAKLIEVAEAIAGRIDPCGGLHEDLADDITEAIDARIVKLWGDRPRFIEVWSGTGDDAEPLTQVYAPHGLPRAPRAP